MQQYRMSRIEKSGGNSELSDCASKYCMSSEKNFCFLFTTSSNKSNTLGQPATATQPAASQAPPPARFHSFIGRRKFMEVSLVLYGVFLHHLNCLPKLLCLFGLSALVSPISRATRQRTSTSWKEEVNFCCRISPLFALV